MMQDERRRGWLAGKSVRKGDRRGGRRGEGGGVKAGIGNVPKLLYRRSIYGDEKHSLPSTPVAPSPGFTTAQKRCIPPLPF